jgi:EpsI family protein
MRFLNLFPVVVLGAGVLLISGIREQHAVEPRTPMAKISKAYLSLPSTDLVVPEEERKVAGMTDYVMRTFGSDSAAAFSVYVGYYDRQVQGKSIHSPKNCLPGAGWEIMETARLPLEIFARGASVNRVLLANKGVRALVYYWYQGRGRVESSEYVVKWNLMRDAAVYGRTEEALVRIVLPIVGRNDAELNVSIAKADAISRALLPTLVADVRKAMPASPSEPSL